MRRVFLSAGHSNSDPGAVANNVREADLTKELRSLVQARLQSNGINPDLDSDALSTGQYVAELKGKTVEGDLIVDIHFNAGPPAATGVEVIIPERHTEAERHLASDLCKAIARRLGIRNRGAKPETQTARGRIAIMHTAGVNVLIEVCFITNKTDLRLYQEKKSEVAADITEVIAHWATKKIG